MGLDMYLNKKFYLWREQRDKLKKSGIKEFEGQEIKELVMGAGYWRKANAIHGWFVDHCNDGDDDNGREYYVSEEDLRELLDTVNKVIKASKLVKGKVQNGFQFKDGRRLPILEDGEYIKDASVAKELLPVREGFFFGNSDPETAYDQYYYQDLLDTKKILEQALKDIDKGFEFTYCASW